MSEVTLTAYTGRETGTRPSRRARAEGHVPAVVYGGGEPAVSVSVDRRDLRRVLSTDAGINALISLSVDGERLLTVVKDLQRHPVRRDVTHVDFLKVDAPSPSRSRSRSAWSARPRRSSPTAASPSSA